MLESQPVNISSNNTNIRIEFCISGDSFRLSEISNTLNLTPKFSWSKGEQIAKSDRKHIDTCWIYSTEVQETLDASLQLKQILTQFAAKESILHDLKNKYNLDFSIDLVVVIENGDCPSIYFDSEIIAFANRIDATIDIDMYVN